MNGLSYAPRYREIEQVLRERIATLEPGQRLPSDADLCVEFGVSRMTARQAMSQLADEGLVRRDPGRGTFVAERPTQRRATFLMTFTHEMRRQGRTPSSRIVRRAMRTPSDIECTELRVGHAEDVLELCRVRLADAIPVAVETAVLSADAATAVADVDLETGSLHEALIAGGITPTGGRSSIAAEAAGRDDSLLLEVELGHPVLVERRLIVDQHGRPVERTESRYAGGRYGLDVGFSTQEGSTGAGAAGQRQP